MADWIGCERDLFWAANDNPDNWHTFGLALMGRLQDPNGAYQVIRYLQRQSPKVQQEFDQCHLENPERFWDVAKQVWHSDGPISSVAALVHQEGKPQRPIVKINMKGPSVSVSVDLQK